MRLPESSGQDPELPHRSPNNTLATLAMLASMAGYVFNDMIIKLIAEQLPLLQAMAVRGVMSTGLIASVALASGALEGWQRMANRRVVQRGVADTAATFLFLTALMQLPIANASSIMNAVPLIMTTLAVIFLGERVGVRRWSAILIGFVGVLLVVQPGAAGFNAYSLLACTAAVVIAIRDLITRGIDPRIPSILVTLFASAAVTVAASAGAIVSGEWLAIDLRQVGLLGLAGVLLFAANHLIIVSLRIGDVATVAPFRYSIILWALLIGYIVWGDVPNLLGSAGIALIIATGVYVMRREYRLKREAAS